MRTTLTLDPDVARLLADAVHRQRRSTKQVVNDALRRALAPTGDAGGERYQVRPFPATLRPGIDPAGFNRLSGELEDEAIVGRARRGS